MKIILEDHRSDKDLLEMKESLAHLHKRMEEIEVGVSALHEWMSTMKQPFDVGLARRLDRVEKALGEHSLRLFHDPIPPVDAPANLHTDL